MGDPRVEAYLTGRLSEPEEAAFVDDLMDNADLQSQVMEMGLLAAGLRAVCGVSDRKKPPSGSPTASSTTGQKKPASDRRRLKKRSSKGDTQGELSL